MSRNCLWRLADISHRKSQLTVFLSILLLGGDKGTAALLWRHGSVHFLWRARAHSGLLHGGLLGRWRWNLAWRRDSPGSQILLDGLGKRELFTGCEVVQERGRVRGQSSPSDRRA